MSQKSLLLLLSLLACVLGIIALIFTLRPPLEDNSSEEKIVTEEIKENVIESETPIPSPPKNPLEGTSWKWIETKAQKETVKPENAKIFLLTFLDEKQFGISAQCNLTGGTYTLSENSLVFSSLFSGKKECSDPQEKTFIQNILDTQSFTQENGELVLILKKDAGTIRFQTFEEGENIESNPATSSTLPEKRRTDTGIFSE